MGIVALFNIIMNIFHILPEPTSNRFSGLFCYSVFIYSFLYSSNDITTQNVIELSTQLCCSNISNETFYESNGCKYLTNKYLCEVNLNPIIQIQPSFSYIMIYGAIIIAYMVANVVALLDIDFKMIVNEKKYKLFAYFVYFILITVVELDNFNSVFYYCNIYTIL